MEPFEVDLTFASVDIESYGVTTIHVRPLQQSFHTELSIFKYFTK